MVATEIDTAVMTTIPDVNVIYRDAHMRIRQRVKVQ